MNNPKHKHITDTEFDSQYNMNGKDKNDIPLGVVAEEHEDHFIVWLFDGNTMKVMKPKP